MYVKLNRICQDSFIEAKQKSKMLKCEWSTKFKCSSVYSYAKLQIQKIITKAALVEVGRYTCFCTQILQACNVKN